MNKRFLVVLVNYLNWQDTLECIESLINSGVNISDIIVVENGSLNDSATKIRGKFPGINLIETGRNMGFSGGNNLGIKYALTGGYSYIILLNNDTVVTNNAIEKLIYEMNRHSEASIGTGQIRCIPDKEKIWYAGGKLIKWRGLALHRGIDKNINTYAADKTGYTEFISGCYMCIRVSSIADLGMLNETFFLYLEDIEYSVRAIKRGLKLLYVPESVIYHKWRGEGELKHNTLYYAVRNRLLLIDMVFPQTAKYYFGLVIRLKMILWYFRNKTLFLAAKRGLEDYRNKYSGPINF